MARMIPPSPATETPPSERQLYKRFQLDLPDDWTVIHSQRFLLPAGRRAPQEGEIDFLVLDPARGALGLEVKGGRVRRGADGWISVDRDDSAHTIKDPGRQASRAVHAIRRYLEDARGFGGKGFRCRFGWGVVLPNSESPDDMGPDIPQDVILDRRSLYDLRSAVGRMFDFWEERGQPARAGGGRPSILSRKGAAALVAALVERFPPASRLALQFREEDRVLLRLTDEQMFLLDCLAAHHRAAIEGSAGTGKTVLALEKARRMATTGSRVLLLCFNRPLAADLRRRADGFRAAGLRVETFHEFCRRLARRAELPFEEPQTVGNERASLFWGHEAPMRLLEALERLPDERYDAIVVDEGQDFLPDWWPCLNEALRDGCDGTLYAFYDPNQDIFAGGPPAALETIEHRLVHNCRNTTRIAEYAANLLGAKAVSKPDAPQGAPVESIICDSDADLVRRVGARLDRLVTDDQVEPDRIAIISTRTLKNSPFAGEHRAGRFELVNLDYPPNRTSRGSSAGRVVFDTLHRFKGLERDVVILLDLPGGDRVVTSHHRYVAASRAKHLLVVVRLGRKATRRGG